MRQHVTSGSRAAILTAALALAALGSPALAQDDPAAFFKDRQLRLVVGSAAGDGYDINARVLARHWVNHIPGKPQIVIQNQPGAASVPMTNALYSGAPRDGSVIGAAINGMTTAPLVTPDVVKFDLAKLIWIGSTNHDIQLTYLWHTSPVRTPQDLMTQEVVVGATNAGTTHVDYPLLARALFGLRFKLVSGYPGTQPVHIAMERGEVAGFGANGWLALKALKADWLEQKKVHFVMQYSMQRSPLFPDVPAIGEIAKTDVDRQAIEMMVTRLQFGRPFFLPPDVPAARVEALRRAFDATMKDAAFLAEAEKAKLDVLPMKGEDIGPLVARVLATPPAVVERVKAALAGGAK
jgi:tripartite-type tricarboxylate transporter receptor subunit TctC